MKKIFKTILVLSLAPLFMISSCSKSSDTVIPTPTIADVTVGFTVTSKNTTNGTTVSVSDGGRVFADDSVVIKVSSLGNISNNLKHLKVTASNQNPTTVFDADITGTSKDFSFFWLVTGQGKVTITATATGASGNPATATFNMVVTNVATNNPSLANQASPASNNYKRFFSAALQNTFDPIDVKNSANYALDTAIDFGYCSRSGGFNKIISPNSQDATDIYATQWTGNGGTEQITNWTKRNATKFRITTITDLAFGAVLNSTSQSQMVNMIASEVKKGEPTFDNITLADKQVILFKTESGSYGLLLVSSPTGSVVSGVAQPGDVNLAAMYFN